MSDFKDVAGEMRDISEVPAVEVITTTAVHLMSAAAVKCGLGEDGAPADLDEARKLITALAGLVTSSAAEIGDRCVMACDHFSLHSERHRRFQTPQARAQAKSSPVRSTS
jgi:hypothetical protein